MTIKKRLMVLMHFTKYIVSNHFYKARILETIRLYAKEEPITIKQDIKERVYIPERQKVKEEAKKSEFAFKIKYRSNPKNENKKTPNSLRTRLFFLAGLARFELAHVRVKV